MKLGILKEWVPSQSPRTWLGINAFYFLYSLLISFYIVISLRETGERPGAFGGYLVWNFSTTIIWCLEAGLESLWIFETTGMAAQEENEGDEGPTSPWWHKLASLDYAANVVELLLAMFYVVVSSTLLWEWKIKNQNVEDSLFDVVTNLTFYFYAMVRDFVRIHNAKTTRNKEGYAQIV